MHTERPEAFHSLLTRATSGDRVAADLLLPQVYDELRKLAAARLYALRPGQTLQPTALVHEAYLRLVGGTDGDPGWNGRGHFFGAAARAMRNILVDHARSRSSLKRGGGQGRVELVEPAAIAGDGVSPELASAEAERTLKLDELISRLEQVDARKAELVSLRFFAGLTHEQIAAALGVTVRTVERDWQFAKAWLQRAMESPDVSGLEPGGKGEVPSRS